MHVKKYLKTHLLKIYLYLILSFLFQTKQNAQLYAQTNPNDDQSCHQTAIASPASMMADHTHVDPFKMIGMRYAYTHDHMQMMMFDWMQGLSKRFSYMAMLGLHQSIGEHVQMGDLNVSLSIALFKSDRLSQELFFSLGAILPSSLFGTKIAEQTHFSNISMLNMQPTNRFALLPRLTYLGHHENLFWGAQISMLTGLFTQHTHAHAHEHEHETTSTTEHSHMIEGNVDQLSAHLWGGYQWSNAISQTFRLSSQILINPLFLEQESSDHLPSKLFEIGLGFQMTPFEIWQVMRNQKISIEWILPSRNPNDLHASLWDNISTFETWTLFGGWQFQF
jgi:hypothetical protein